MNKLRFEARVLDLYSVDYEYLQDEIEAQGRKILRQTLQNPGTAMVIKGFKLRVSPSDTSKMQIYHDGTWSSAISTVGRLVESQYNIDLIEASDNTPGVTNYVYIRSSTGYGTYNRISGLVELGVQGNIDYHDFQQVYDREVDVWEIAVYTADEVNALSSESFANLIPLGNFVANGLNPIVEVSTAGRIDAKTFVADGSIETSMISETGLDLPQSNVSNSTTYDDTFSGTPADIEDDLNRIRYFIREIKGTDRWDDFLANNLTVFDATVNDLHDNGIMQDIRQEFDVIPNSTGLEVLVRGGKALLEGVIEGIPEDEYSLLSVDFQPRYAQGNEYVFITVAGDYPLFYNHIDSLVISTSPGGPHAYQEGTDYTLNTSSGVITVTSTGNLVGDGAIYCTYFYGFERHDLVEIGPDHDTNLIKGVSATSTGRIPAIPEITDGYLPLSVVKVYPHLTTIPSANIKQYKSFVPKVRNLYFTPCTDVGEVGYQVKKMVYHIDTDYIDAGYTQWSLTQYDQRDVAVSSTVGSYITSSIYLSEGGELWLIADKNIWDAEIDVEWSTSTGILDSSTTIDLKWRYELRYNPILIAKDLSEGQHKIKITVTAASGAVAIYGLMSGKTSLQHLFPSRDITQGYLNNMLVEDVTNNIGIGIDTIESGITGDYNTAIGYGSLLANTTGTKNVGIGVEILNANTIGGYNVGIGNTALYSNVSGEANVAIGNQPLYSNTGGNYNIAIGREALWTNTTGNYNVALGFLSLNKNTTGVDNTAVGQRSLENNTSGRYNIGLGYYSLRANITGSYNVALGYEALVANTYGDSNVAIGIRALKSSTTGSGNVAIGQDAMDTSTSGHNNIGIGNLVLTDLTEGDDNIALGRSSGQNITTGDDNICLGYDSGSAITTASGTVVIGSIAAANASNRTYIANIYGDTTTAAPNVYIDSNGRVQRTTDAAVERGVPVGSVLSWLPGYFTTTSPTNSGFTDVAAVEDALPDWWQICDGSVVQNSGSALYAGGAGRVPNLTSDIFLMGSTDAGEGVQGGTNTIPDMTHNADSHNHAWHKVEYSKYDTCGQHVVLPPCSCPGTSGNSIDMVNGPKVRVYWYTQSSIEYYECFSYYGHTYNASGSKIDIPVASGVIAEGTYYTNNDSHSHTTHSLGSGSNRPKYLSCRYIMRIY